MRARFVRRRLLARVLAGSLLCAALPKAFAAPEAGIGIGLIAASTTAQVIQDWKPFTDALARELKMPVHVVASTRYTDIAEALKEGRVQLAWTNNKLAIELVESEVAKVFAQMVRLDGTRGYKSVLLVRKDSPIRSLPDVLQRPGVYSFGSGDPKSTSGFLVPNYYVFAKHKIEPERHFTKITHGNHLANMLAVADGTVDVATNNTEEIPRYKAEHAGKFEQVRVLWESPLIPNDPIVLRNDLPVATQQRVRPFFAKYGSTEAERATLKNINGLSAFRPSSNYQLRPIVDLEMFQALTRAMRAKDGAKESDFSAEMAKLTQRAARLDGLLNSTRLDTP